MEGYQGYQDYQNYQRYQGNNFRPFPQQRRFQQAITSNKDQWSNGIRMLNQNLDTLIHMVQQQSNPYNPEWMTQSNFSWEDQGNHSNYYRPFHQPDFQQESKEPWEVANNTTSERLDRLESSIKNVEVLLGQLANSNNS